MNAKEFLQNKGLLEKDKDNFTIIQDEEKYDLIQIMEDYSDSKWKERYLRLAADFENHKKRVESDKNDLKISVRHSVLESVLELDNDMNLAYKMLNDESSKETVKIFMDKMNNFLKSEGIEEIQTEEYDKDLHDVIHISSPGSEKISDVVSKGYKIAGKVVKYPKVVLS